MTSRGRDSAFSGGLPTETEFKWICPYCGNSRINWYAKGERGEEKTVAALRSHIVGSNGDGHGPRNEAPAGRERTLFEYVCRVERRRWSVSAKTNGTYASLLNGWFTDFGVKNK